MDIKKAVATSDSPIGDNEYHNFWLDLAYSAESVKARCDAIWQQLRHSPDYGFAVESADELYFYDTGNNDVRTEGQSYGMTLAVFMNDQAAFNKTWRWTLNHMYLTEGPCRGYFAWSVPLDGSPRAQGPAPDGEEFFAYSLILAHQRWGQGEATDEYCLDIPYFDYLAWAKEILHDVLHRNEGEAGPMWTENNLIQFVPNATFTDPSYHLPHVYHLFADYANEADRGRWLAIEQASLDYLPKSIHPLTGMNPEYSSYEGEAITCLLYHNFFSDAYRTHLNVALAGTWPGRTKEQWMIDMAESLAEFFWEIPTDEFRRYELDGTDGGRFSRHPIGLLGSLASTYMLSQSAETEALARRFWDSQLRTGHRRYYDNFLYAFAFLALAGTYRGSY